MKHYNKIKIPKKITSAKSILVIIFAVVILVVTIFLLNSILFANPSKINSRYLFAVNSRKIIPYSSFGSDCANNFDCFLQMSQYCINSSMNLNYNITRDGLIYSFNQLLEIYSNNLGNCVWYQKTLGIKIIPINDSFLESAYENQISSNRNVGLFGVCNYSSTGMLNTVLQSWQQNNFSTIYFGNSNCSGTIFNSTNSSFVYSNLNNPQSCSLNSTIDPTNSLHASVIITTYGVPDGTLLNYYCVSSCLLNSSNGNLYGCNPSIPLAGNTPVYNSQATFDCLEPVPGYYDLFVQNVSGVNGGVYCNQTLFFPTSYE